MFGIYVHIPYCLQRCTYCDFATYEKSKIFPSHEYIEILKAEISQRARYHHSQKLDTLYFGGGTPSLLPASEIVAIIQHLAKHGYMIQDSTEVTIEINPATINEEKLKQYLDNGINRFSVGAQTFDDRLLKMVRREHSAQQTFETLNLLSKHNLNFSFDILFALPSQELSGLERDLTLAMEQGARHISPYCLTVPDGHPLSKGRAPEEEQVEMFDLIYDKLTAHGFLPYEISNFSKPGFESKHNLLYWTDEDYWGLGLSAHSYLKKDSPWGTRYWNINSLNEYRKEIETDFGRSFDSPNCHRAQEQYENLEVHQALTDFCHTSLRLMRGLSLSSVKNKFGVEAATAVELRLNKLLKGGSLQQLENGAFALHRKSLVLSNQIFAEMTFLRDEIPALSHIDK